ncbi:MAG TPA: sulfatase-like hydrolase/transferase [Parafilimonas sp.]|nr:sulfatase-like hydrolase/transferase [Parafilimonas sp.]
MMFFLSGLLNKTRAQSQKPNIILILTDDIGYAGVGYNGANLYSTPNIDTLARRGMQFRQCHAMPLCSPSRFMLLTGKYNFRNYSDWGVMDLDQRTIGNMMKDGGYKTGCYGKWQLGSRQSINTFGFDNYCVYLDSGNDNIKYSRYKNPHIIANGKYLADGTTFNKYGEDIFTDSVLHFIEGHQSTPFFIYYSMVLAHGPFCPTPDDATAFSAWDSNPNNSDTSFHKSMIKYMDKKIGQIVDKIKSLGIEKNTIIIFTGDNGTPGTFSDHTGKNDNTIKGGKGSTKEAGTHVPLIVAWPNTIVAGSINDDLIDFTDLLPTLAGMANISVPTDYGPLDGVSFYPRLKNQSGTPRAWIFSHYYRPNRAQLTRWAQTVSYKLYDTSAAKPKRLFYNIVKDINESHPIADTELTAGEIMIKQQLLNVINSYVAQGKPLLSLQPSISIINDSSIRIDDTIKANGGSTVTASGVVWSTNPNPEVSSSRHTSTGVILGAFSASVQGLASDTTYYIRAYATNFAGTVYSNQLTFKPMAPPVATAATTIDSVKFTANWEFYPGSNYRLDISTSPTFTKMATRKTTEGFNNGVISLTGWTISNNVVANTTEFNIASPSLEFTTSGAQVVTQQFPSPVTQLSFWIKGLNTSKAGSLLVEGYNGNNWATITTLTNLSKNGSRKTFNATSNPPLSQNFTQFRFTYTKKAGTLAFDDVSIRYKNSVPFFIQGYDNLRVKINSKLVTGLTPATSYYYRVRAISGGIATDNSNVVVTTTNSAASLTAEEDIALAGNRTKHYDNNRAAAKESELLVSVSPNPSSAEFTLAIQSDRNERSEIIVMDMYGRKVCRTTGSSNSKYTFGKTLAPGEYFVFVSSGKLNRMIKILKAN